MAEPKIRRENFADEASWLEFQHNQLELAKHKRQREATQGYAAQGRDYDIIKRINRRMRKRASDLARYWADPEKARQKARVSKKRYYSRHKGKDLARARRWRAANREYVRQYAWIYKRNYYAAHSVQLRAKSKQWYEQNRLRARLSRRKYQADHQQQMNDYRREWRAIKRATDTEWHEREKMKAREYRVRIAQDTVLREQRLQRERTHYAAHREEINAYQRERRARKRAEKPAQQQKAAS